MAARRVSLALCSSLNRCTERGFCVMKNGIAGCVCPPGLNEDCSPTTTVAPAVIEKTSHAWIWVFGAIVFLMLYSFLGFILKKKYPDAAPVAVVLWPVTLIYSAINNFYRDADEL